MNAEQIKNARDKLGWTRRQMAEALGYISPYRMSEIESGRRRLGGPRAALLAYYLAGGEVKPVLGGGEMTGEEFAAARKALGATQEDIARAVGYASGARISEIEAGKRAVTPAVRRLVEILRQAQE